MIKQNDRRDYFVEAFQKEKMKTYRERISLTDSRIRVIYEAHADTKDQQSCLATVYVYDDATDEPSYSIEKQALWDKSWDDSALASAQLLGYDLSVNGEV